MSDLKHLYEQFDAVRRERDRHLAQVALLQADLAALKKTDADQAALRVKIRAAKEPIFALAREESRLAKAVFGKPRPA